MKTSVSIEGVVCISIDHPVLGSARDYLTIFEARSLARMLCAAADAQEGKPWPDQPAPIAHAAEAAEAVERR